MPKRVFVRSHSWKFVTLDFINFFLLLELWYLREFFHYTWKWSSFRRSPHDNLKEKWRPKGKANLSHFPFCFDPFSNLTTEGNWAYIHLKPPAVRNALYFLSQSGLLMLWIFVLVFRSCCYITSCKMKCSVWFGSCWGPRTDKSKETYGVWSLRSRRCLAMGAVLTIKSKIKKRQTWMICGEETFGRGSIMKPNNMKTWINSKFAQRTFSSRF